MAGESGSVTAEAAILAPAMIVLLALCLAALSAGLAQIAVVDASRCAAREAARGESDDVSIRLARKLAPGADIVIARNAGRISVSASMTAPGPAGVGRLLQIPVSAVAVAVEEDQ